MIIDKATYKRVAIIVCLDVYRFWKTIEIGGGRLSSWLYFELKMLGFTDIFLSTAVWINKR